MKKVLKTKLAKGNSNELWDYVYHHIDEYVTQAEVADYASSTVKEIQAIIRGMKVAYGWSAGKDSVVLSDLCRKAGKNYSQARLYKRQY